MNPNAEPRPDDPELEALIETAAEDALDAAAEPHPGAALEDELPSREEATGDKESDWDVSAGPEPGEPGPSAEPGAAPKLERLQKILAQAGVASRRHAEELIAAGRVQVNGNVVTTPGSKADAARDHIRVDGKLIRSAERLRYFVLNKPKGFVTTVSDPEGRPTVMQFFGKTHERLYPVGRLDYQSEGLLLVTNDGELANRLTHAASGVEKTYLVKVSGRPTAAELDALRRGVAIDRGRTGSSRVETAPARVREVRKGDNPWFEVVLTEGRNRELRKMFQEIGHFVEKIRRVGYGPLILDVEPGKMRELTADEVAALRRAAEGKAAPMRASYESRTDRGGERKGQKRRPGTWDGQAAGKPGSRAAWEGRDFSRAKRDRLFSNSEQASAREKPAAGRFSRATGARPKRQDRPARYPLGAPADRRSGGARPGGSRRRPSKPEGSRDFAGRPRGREGRSNWRAQGGREGQGSTENRFTSSRAGPAQRPAGTDSSRFESRDERRGGRAGRGRERFDAGSRGPSRYRGRITRDSAPASRQRRDRAGGPRDPKRPGQGRRDRH